MRDLESRIRAVVKRRTPKGWTVKESALGELHSSSGSAGCGGTTIRCPPLVDRDGLATFLHEVAHVVLGHCGDPTVPHWLAEYEAEQWVFRAMRAEGIAVSERYRGVARHGVKCYVEQAQANDPDVEIDEAVLRYAYPDNWKMAA